MEKYLQNKTLVFTTMSLIFFKYALVGSSGVLIDFGTTAFCKEILNLNKFVSSAIGFIIAATTNFILNLYWTFNSDAQHFGIQYSKFILIALSGLLISYFFLFILEKKSSTNFYFLKLMVILLVFGWNYTLNIFFTFK